MKKRILCFLLSFVLLFALCPTYAFAADSVASITPSGASSPTVYFTSFNDCANALKDNSDYQDCTVKIHAYKNTDTTALYVKGGTFTLNLNGFSLNNLTVESGTVTVTGDGAGGSNHNYIGKLYVKSGVTVSINQGTYDYLENDGGTVTLTGGKYIQIESKQGMAGEMLPTDYAFSMNGSIIDAERTSGVYSAKGVTVVEHKEHTLGLNNWCYWCGKKLVATLKNGDTTSYFTALSRAFESAGKSENDGCTVTLIRDNDERYSDVNYGNFIFDTNGFYTRCVRTYGTAQLVIKGTVGTKKNINEVYTRGSSKVTVEGSKMRTLWKQQKSTLTVKGGMFGTVEDRTGGALVNLLPVGYVFKSESTGKYIDASNKTASGETVSVVAHNCDYNTDGTCKDANCECSAAIMAYTNYTGKYNYYRTFEECLKSEGKSASTKLLKDLVSMPSYYNIETSIAINLNGKTINELRVKAGEGRGLRLSGKGTVNKISVTGTTTELLFYSEEVSYGSPYIGEITVNAPGSVIIDGYGSNVQFGGGRFGKITCTDGRTLDKLLEKNKEFADASGNRVDASSITESTEELKIIRHTHSYSSVDGKCECGAVCPHEKYDGSTGICKTCKMQVYYVMDVNEKGGGITRYKTLAEALKNTDDGHTILFLADYALSGTNEDNTVNKNITLYLFGKNLTAGTADTLTIGKNASVTIKESSSALAKINVLGGLTISDGTYSAVTVDGGTLRMSGGILNSVTSKNGTLTLSGGICNSLTANGGTLTANGCTFNNTLTVKDGKFIGKSGSFDTVSIEGTGSAEITSGTYKKLTVENSDSETLESLLGKNSVYKTSTGELTVANGLKTVENVSVVYHSHYFNGTANCRDCDMVCENHIYDSDGKCTICKTAAPFIVKIGDSEPYYATVKEAVAAAKNAGDKVCLLTLNSNFEVTDERLFKVTSGKLTIDLNGYTLNATKDVLYITGGKVTVTDSKNSGGTLRSSTAKRLIYINGGQLTLANGTYRGRPSLLVEGNAEVVLDKPKFGAVKQYAASVTLNGGTTLVTGNMSLESGLFSVKSGKLLLKGGRFAEIAVTSGTLEDILSDGYTYKDYYGQFITKYAVSSMKNIRVVAHDHSFGLDSTCTSCGFVCEKHRLATDGICTRCGYNTSPTTVTKDNYKELGLTEDYIGFSAIRTLDHLISYSKNPARDAVLIGDIRVDKYSGFTGILPNDKIFDGNGHTIMLLFSSVTETEEISGINFGLFREKTGGEIKNLTLEGRIEGAFTGSVGALMGVGSNVKVEKVMSTVTVSVNRGANNFAGGLAGEFSGTVENCAVYADLKADYAGGFVGKANSSVSIKSCAFFSNSANASVWGSFVSNNACEKDMLTIESSYYYTLSRGAIVGDGEEERLLSDVVQVAADSFYSGRVAYLLAEINGGKVWGQTSNASGALPILTDNEDYRVLSVVGGGYSILKKGETNGDGVVDVNDYQNLVNAALSENNTAEFSQYDINGDGVVDVLDCIAAKASGVSDEQYSKIVSLASTLTKGGYTLRADINGDGAVDVLDCMLLEQMLGGHRVIIGTV